jgi:hypothetical protein
MDVVDSSGWVEYFTKGSNARFFIPPVQDLDNLQPGVTASSARRATSSA